MPRPKRTKVAPSAPAPRVSRKPSKTPAPAAAASKEPENIFDDIYDVSDREERVVARARRARNSKGKERAGTAPREAHTEAEGITSLVSQGEETAIVRDLGSHGRGDQSEGDELEDFEGQLSSPAVEVGRKSTAGIGNSTFAMGDRKSGRRQLDIGPQAERSSSVDSDLAEANGLTSVGKKNTSVLSMANFRRRARQPSIIGRNTRVRSSSVGLNMDATPAHMGSSYKIGTFKRRAREPSILRTAQKERQPRPHFDDDDASEDDFNPEDESTPLNLSKSRAMAQQSSQSATSGTPGSNPKKRKLSAVQVPQSSPPLPSIEVEDAPDVVPATGTHISDEEEAASSSEEQDTPAAADDAAPEEPWSETMAPPQSSSPTRAEITPPRASTRRGRSRPHSPEPLPPRGRRPLRGRTPPPATQDSPISSPPSLTHSPNRPIALPNKGRGRRRPAVPTTFSTAQLQALLPRRRRRPATDVFEIVTSEDEVDVSGLASDDDELSHLTVRAAPRRPAGRLTRTPAPLKRGPKPKANQKRPAKRTYGSRNSNKENEEADVDPDDSLAPIQDENRSSENSQEMEERVGKELKKAAKKFKEVDKWELEFEDVTASSSSPRDAR